MVLSTSETGLPRLWVDTLARVSRGRRWGVIAGLGLWALAAAAAVRGELLATSPQPEGARPWLVAAALLALPAVLLIERDLPESTSAELPFAFRDRPLFGARRRRGAIAIMVVGAAYALVATAFLGWQVPESAATSAWLAALIAATLGALLLQPLPRLHVNPQKTALLQLGLLLIVLCVAVWLRFPDLSATPPEVHGDEAAIGLDARRILAGQMPPVFATGWYDVPALSFAAHALTMRLFGDNLFGLRIQSAIEGILTIVVLFLLTRRLWGPRPALLAAALLTVAEWHIHFSRTGFHYMQAPLTTLLVLYFLVRAIQDRRPVDWLMCGFAIGLGVEVYYAARLTPVIVAVFLAYCALTDRAFLRTHRSGLVILVLGAAIFLLPMIAVFARNPLSFNARTSGVLIFDPANLRHELGAYQVQTLPQVILIQTQRTLEAFNIHGETSIQYQHPTPLLDPWTGGLLATAVLALLLRVDSRRGFLLAAWVWLGLFAGSVLTVDALFSPRVLLVLPALMIGSALMLETLWRGIGAIGGTAATYAFALPVLALLAVALQANVHDYFDVQVVDRAPASRFTLLARYAQSVTDQYRLYVIGREDFSMDYETPRFLVPGADAVNVRNGSLDLPLRTIPAAKGVAFVVETGAADYATRLDSIRSAYPGGQESLISERPGRPTFTAYRVEHSQLVTANPTADLN